MRHVMHRLQVRLAAWLEQDRQVADEMARINLHRLRWILGMLLALAATLAAVFWSGAGGTGAVHDWRQRMGWAHLGFMTWCAVLAAACAHARRQPPGARLAQALQRIVPASSVLFSAAFAVLDQQVTSNISPFILGSMATSLLLLMRPGTAVLVHALGFGALYVGLGYTQADPALLLTNRTNGLGASLVSVLLAWTLWNKDAGYMFLQRELQARHATLQRQQEELVRLATRDALTGVCNRGELLRLAEAELARARRQGTATSAIMIDLDHFKRINDDFGHQVGDAALRHAAQLLLDGVRRTDFVGRMGGEEFMVVLPDTALADAAALAEKLRERLQTQPLRAPTGQDIVVTASLGAATAPVGHDATSDWLYAAADHALYEAKRSGRNRVHCAAPDRKLTASDYQRLRKS